MQVTYKAKAKADPKDFFYSAEEEAAEWGVENTQLFRIHLTNVHEVPAWCRCQ